MTDTKFAPYVEWIEPWDHGTEMVVCRMSVSDVIAVQKRTAAHVGYEYKDDQKAIDDFTTVHWATVVMKDTE